MDKVGGKMKNKILIVDDEAHIRELLKFNLESNGFMAIEAETGEEALQSISKEIDLVLLDYMLPGIDGMGVLRELKNSKAYHQIPVIMLTARQSELDTVLGLELGADDYISKPFRLRELIARVKTVLRRSKKIVQEQVKEEKIIVNELMINNEKKTVKIRDEKLRLSLKEYDLLFILASYPGIVFTREQLLSKVWGYEYIGGTRTVDVHIRQLRKKIEKDDKHPEYLLTARGIGYKFKDVEECKENLL